tara:strand:- start:23635 stop:24582 length:948 start_codon:yes stop_codon:yes gene_type:complete
MKLSRGKISKIMKKHKNSNRNDKKAGKRGRVKKEYSLNNKKRRHISNYSFKSKQWQKRHEGGKADVNKANEGDIEYGIRQALMKQNNENAKSIIQKLNISDNENEQVEKVEQVLKGMFPEPLYRSVTNKIKNDMHAYVNANRPKNRNIMYLKIDETNKKAMDKAIKDNDKYITVQIKGQGSNSTFNISLTQDLISKITSTKIDPETGNVDGKEVNQAYTLIVEVPNEEGMEQSAAVVGLNKTIEELQDKIAKYESGSGVRSSMLCNILQGRFGELGNSAKCGITSKAQLIAASAAAEIQKATEINKDANEMKKEL